MELNMKCKDCNAINFGIPYAEKETRKCSRCGGELKEITVDFKEDGEENAAAEAPEKEECEGVETPEEENEETQTVSPAQAQETQNV